MASEGRAFSGCGQAGRRRCAYNDCHVRAGTKSARASSIDLVALGQQASQIWQITV